MTTQGSKPKTTKQPLIIQRRCVPEAAAVIYFLPFGVKEAIKFAQLYYNKN